MGDDKSGLVEIVSDRLKTMTLSDLGVANRLMVEALSILDRHGHAAAPHLDLAIVKLGLRPEGEGLPPDTTPE